MANWQKVRKDGQYWQTFKDGKKKVDTYVWESRLEVQMDLLMELEWENHVGRLVLMLVQRLVLVSEIQLDKGLD